MSQNTQAADEAQISDINAAATDQVKAYFKDPKRVALFIKISLVFMIPGILSIIFGGLEFNTVGMALSAPLLVLFLIYSGVLSAKRELFWQQIAKTNGWVHTAEASHRQEKSVIIRKRSKEKEGYDDKLLNNVITGRTGGREFRIFEFMLKKGDSFQHFTIFAFKFLGVFPNILLNYRNNHHDIRIGEYISTPIEFEKKYLLSVAKEYEIEALQIFTPEIMAYLLENEISHDIEFVDQEVMFFTEGMLFKHEDFQKIFAQCAKVADLLGSRLDNMGCQKIGDLSQNL